MFKKRKHLGHSARWEITEDGGWAQICSCGETLIRYPGRTELSKALRS